MDGSSGNPQPGGVLKSEVSRKLVPRLAPIAARRPRGHLNYYIIRRSKIVLGRRSIQQLDAGRLQPGSCALMRVVCVMHRMMMMMMMPLRAMA